MPKTMVIAVIKQDGEYFASRVFPRPGAVPPCIPLPENVFEVWGEIATEDPGLCAASFRTLKERARQEARHCGLPFVHGLDESEG